MNETWLPIPGHDGYEVSTRGRVRSYIPFGRRTSRRLPEPRILKPDPTHGGYQKVTLQGRKVRGIHQLVLLAFVGPCPECCEVDHIDCNPRNNTLANLQYLTPKQNRAARAARRKAFQCGHPIEGNEYRDGPARTCHRCKRKSWREAAARRRRAQDVIAS